MLDKRLLAEAGKVRYYFALTIGLGLGSGLLIILQAGWFARIVNGVFLQHQGLEEVKMWLILLLGVIILRAVLAWLSEVFAQRTAVLVKEELRQRLLAHLFSLGPLFVRGERTGELANLLVEGVESLEAYFARYLPQLALAALVPLLMLSFIFPLDLFSGLVMLCTAPLIPLFMVLIGKWAEGLSQKQWAALSRMSAHFLDVLQGLTTLKIFGRSKSQAEVIARVSDEFRKSTLGVLRVAFLSALVLELFSTLSTAVVAVALGLRLVYQQMPFQQAFFLLLLAPEFYLPLRLLGTQFHAGASGTQAAKRIFEVLSAVPVKDDPMEIHSSVPDGGLRISFEGVNYAYEKDRSPALEEASFDLLPGEITALVGASGSGKSTIAHLLLRFAEPDQGSICVNGLPLNQIQLAGWRSQVAFAPQHPHIFSGSVAENIRLGDPMASDEEMQVTARLARAHDFIRDLPQGYETKIGEGGIQLSGGQVRRIALARVFLRKSKVIILDEALSGLDQEREKEIYHVLREAFKDRTILMISHGLSSLCQADRVIVLDKGFVVEAGTPEQLMEKKGVYYGLAVAYGGGA